MIPRAQCGRAPGRNGRRSRGFYSCDSERFDARWLGEVLALAALYFLTARLGLLMAIPGGHVTPVWPPSGIALAAVLLRGRRVWPGIWLGSFAANLWDFYGSPMSPVTDLATSAMFGIGASLTALLGSQLLRRFVGEHNPLERVRDVCAFMALGGVVSCLVSATVGVTTLCLAGFAPWLGYTQAWLTWWLGDTAGVFIVAPLLLVWGGVRRRKSPARWVELFVGFGLLIAVTHYVFIENTTVLFTGKPLTFILIPFLIWSAVRFGRRGAATAAGLIALLAVWGTIHGSGPFHLGSRNESLLALELFLSVVSFTALCIAAVVMERRRVLDELESRVAERTASLDQANAALRESEARTRLLIKSSNIGLWDWNLVTNDVFFSPEWKSQLGYADDEVPGRYEEWESRLHPEDREPSLRAVQDFRAGRRQDYDAEFRLRHKDGSWRSILTRADLIRDAAGQPARMLGCHIDITSRKQAEEALRKAEEQYRSIFNNAVDGIFRTSPHGKFLVANLAAARIFGFTSPEELIEERRDIAQEGYVDPRRRDEFKRLLQEQGVVNGFEYEAYRKDGSRVWISENTRAVHSPSGDILYFEGIFEDVTDRKRTEAALRESEERFRTIFEQAPLGISEGEIATARLINANQRYVDILGYTIDELGKLTFKDYSHPEDLQKDLVLFQKLAAGEIRTYAMEKRYVRKDGAIIWVNLTVSSLARPGEKPLNCIAVIDDITDRIQAEAALAAQAIRYKTLMETSTDSIYVVNEKGDLQEANAAFLRRRGYTAAEVKGLNVADWDAQWSREQLQERLRKLVGSSAVFETRHRCKDGSVFDVEVCATSVRIGEEQLFFAVTREITERKRAERQSQMLIDVIPQQIWSGPPDGTLDYCNHRWRSYMGIGLADLQGEGWQTMLHPEDRERVLKAWHESVLNGTPYEQEERHRGADGTFRWFLARGVPQRDTEGRIVRWYGTNTDIEDRKRAEEELEEANHQLRFLSRRLFHVQEEERRHLARELHDEVGQALTAAKINLQAAVKESDGARSKRIDETAAILEKLLGQVRQISLDLRPSTLDDLGLVPALRSLLDQQGRRASVAVHLSAKNVPENLDAEIQTTCFRIGQEAITNAVRHANATRIDVDLSCENGNLRLQVRDNGRGFDADAVQAQAVGLGLVGIKERAALVDARARIISSPNNGTTVEVSLPLAFPPERESRVIGK